MEIASAAAAVPAAERPVVCAVDFGQRNYWTCTLSVIGGDDEPLGAGCAVSVLEWRNVDLSGAPALREARLVSSVLGARRPADAPPAASITDWDLELQNPLTRTAALRICNGNARAAEAMLSGNAITYGQCCALKSALNAHFGARTRVRTTHPRVKFTVARLPRSAKKSARKSMMVRFVRAIMRTHRTHFGRWADFFESLPKQDDAADVFAAALARISHILAKRIDLRRVRAAAASGSGSISKRKLPCLPLRRCRAASGVVV
jgi:hypothetical protein